MSQAVLISARTKTSRKKYLQQLPKQSITIGAGQAWNLFATDSESAMSLSSESSLDLERSSRSIIAARALKKRRSTMTMHLKSLSDFETVRTLGTGSYGRVFLVRDKREGQHHALKVLEKAKVVRKNQVEHTRNELALMSSINCDFIVNMKCSFKDNSNIFLVLDFAIGGEMWSHMRKRPGMKESDALFYGAQMFLALEYLQSYDIVHRDLKTENILIDANGYLKLADFGFAKRVPHRTWTVCGTSEYMAPEIIREGKRHKAGLGLGDGYGKQVDWWAYGILVFEMANHRPPFRHKDKNELYSLILECKVAYPSAFSALFVDLLKQLLVTDPVARFTAHEIRQSAWIKSVNLEALSARAIRPPYMPKYGHLGDSAHFDSLVEEPIKSSPVEEFPEHFSSF